MNERKKLRLKHVKERREKSEKLVKERREKSKKILSERFQLRVSAVVTKPHSEFWMPMKGFTRAANLVMVKSLKGRMSPFW